MIVTHTPDSYNCISVMQQDRRRTAHQSGDRIIKGCQGVMVEKKILEH